MSQPPRLFTHVFVASLVSAALSAVAATPVTQDQPPTVAKEVAPIARADALLSVDSNRHTIVERIVRDHREQLAKELGKNTDWEKQFRDALTNLRADDLLAASLADGADGVTQVLERGARGKTTAHASQPIAHQVLGDNNRDLVYTPLAPCRVFDTRTAFGGAGPLPVGAPRTYTTRGNLSLNQQGGNTAGCGIPSGVAAVQLQMSPVLPAGIGWITGNAQGQALNPNAALFTYNTGDLNTASVSMPLNLTNGQFTIQANNTATELIGDVLGYFGAASSGAGGPGGLVLPFTGNANSASSAFTIINAGAGTAIIGSSPNASGDGVSGISLNGAGLRSYSENGFGVYALSNAGSAAVYGKANNVSGSGVQGDANGGTAAGVFGVNPSGSGVWGRTSGTAQAGVFGENSTANGYGVWGRSEGNGVYGRSGAGTGTQGTSDTGTGVWGISFGANGYGVRGQANSGVAGVWGQGNASTGVMGLTQTGTAGVFGSNTSNPGGSGVDGTCAGGASCAGVYGHTDTGVGVWGRNRGGTAVRADGNAMQELGFGGFVKAMVVVDYLSTPPLQRCFNSQRSGAAMTTAPCGITVTNPSEGVWDIFFGFDTSNRFASLALGNFPCKNGTGVGTVKYFASAVRVEMTRADTGDLCNTSFTLIVY